MGILHKILTGVTVGAGAILTSATPAAAAPTFVVSPSTVKADTSITVKIINCASKAGQAWLTEADKPVAAVTLAPVGGNALSGLLHIPSDLKPGGYLVSGRCGSITPKTATVVVAPHGTIETGDGTTINRTHILLTNIGGALIATAGIGATMLLLRRKRNHS